MQIIWRQQQVHEKQQIVWLLNENEILKEDFS